MNELGELMARYDTRTIKYSEDGPGAYELMITRFDADGNDVLESAGFGGDNLLITKLGPGKMDSWYDPRACARAFCANDDDNLKDFLVELDRNYELWKELEDGVTLDPERIQVMLDGD